MRWGRAITALAVTGAITAVLVPGCEEQKQVRLVFAERTLGDVAGRPGIGGPAGFACLQHELPLTPLANRAIALPVPRLTLVVDFIQLGGSPSCRLGSLTDWCATHTCTPIAEARVCMEVPLTTVAGTGDLQNGIESIRKALAELATTQLTEDAPDEDVVVRAVGTTERCADLAASHSLGFDCHKLAGCAYSCPVRLDTVEGDVVLDLDTVAQFCADSVFSCASANGFRLDPECAPSACFGIDDFIENQPWYPGLPTASKNTLDNFLAKICSGQQLGPHD